MAIISSLPANLQNKKVIVFDFDGVLHSYVTPWNGATCIPDPPVPGMIALCHRLVNQGMCLVCVSSRAVYPGGVEAIKEYLNNHLFPEFSLITDRKIPAEIYIDDRGFRFDGTNVEALAEFLLTDMKPWNKTPQFTTLSK